MYNRYIPQPDGTYRRRQYQDTPNQKTVDNRPREARWPPSQDAGAPQPEKPPQSCPDTPPVRHRRPSGCNRPCPPRPAPRPPKQDSDVLGFLKKLLPKNFDTGDLMIVLLLLLMSGDCQEEQNSALLTLVLYLFL